MHKIKALLSSRSAWRVYRTFGYAFLGVLVPGALGWLHGLTEWATTDGQAPFPDAVSLGYVAVSAVVAGVVAIVNGVGVWLENLTGHAIGRTPGE